LRLPRLFQAREAVGDLVAGVVGDPAFRGDEQADGLELRLRAHVEPVAHHGRHRNQVAARTQHAVDPAGLADVEQGLAVDEEAHLEFVVGMLAQEFLAQGFLLRVVLLQGDHVHRLEAVLVHQPVDRAAIGLDHLVLGGVGVQVAIRLPALELHADPLQLGADVLEIGIRGDRPGRFLVDSQFAHCTTSRSLTRIPA
jgi:hypothetical protein